MRIDAHVGDAGDGGARLLREGGEGREEECGEEREKFHWLGHCPYTSEDSIRTQRGLALEGASRVRWGRGEGWLARDGRIGGASGR